jgi:hypothetical protein
MDYITGILLCLITGNLSHRNGVPDTIDVSVLYHYICTVTVQLPMHVLHSICYGYTYSGDDQLPNVAYRN